MTEQELPAEGYDGTAVLAPMVEVRGAPATSHETTMEVEVTLRGHFEPLDGRFHWYGRITADEGLAARHPSGSTVVLITPYGRAEGRLSDVDPWGRFRVAGHGAPPFPA